WPRPPRRRAARCGRAAAAPPASAASSATARPNGGGGRRSWRAARPRRTRSPCSSSGPGRARRTRLCAGPATGSARSAIRAPLPGGDRAPSALRQVVRELLPELLELGRARGVAGLAGLRVHRHEVQPVAGRRVQHGLDGGGTRAVDGAGRQALVLVGVVRRRTGEVLVA